MPFQYALALSSDIAKTLLPELRSETGIVSEVQAAKVTALPLTELPLTKIPKVSPFWFPSSAAILRVTEVTTVPGGTLKFLM